VSARKVAIAVIPLVAMAALATGLRIGASEATRAAAVLGAPRAHGANVVAWQIETFIEDRGLREKASVDGLVVTAGGAEWRGATNADGVAEARLALPKDARDVWVEVRDAREILASGRAEIPEAWRDVAHPAWARATRREGAIALDVAPFGERLPVGFPGSLWIRAMDRATGAALAGVAIDAEPEPGLDITSPHAVTCASGWAELVVTPTFHVTGVSLHAKKDGKEGLWFGVVPVAGGASHVSVPLTIVPGVARGADVTAGGAKATIYAEIDDGEGRAAAAVLAVPNALFEIPPLDEGLYWLVTSNTPRGAEAIEGGTAAQPVLVTREALDRCALAPKLAPSAPTGFPRTLVVDGFAGRGEAMRSRRRLGTAIGLGALVIAALLEGLLVLGAARRARIDLDPRFSKKSPAGSVAIGLLAALLGFALLAALLLYRAT
jgi:hypothetical protein